MIGESGCGRSEVVLAWGWSDVLGVDSLPRTDPILSNVSSCPCRSTQRKTRQTYRTAKTYQLVNIPASMLTSFLCLGATLVHPEVPIHVRCLPTSALFICLEPPAALCAWRAKVFEKLGDKMRLVAVFRALGH